MEAPAKRIDKKKLDELCKDFLENYQVSMIIGFDYSRMRPILCAIGTDGGPDLIRANVLGLSWLHTIR